MKITLNNLNDVFKSKQESVESMELKGYKLITKFFVDNSGMGAKDEPALTINQFLKELEAFIKKSGSLEARLINVGQFQVYVGLFYKSNKGKSKKIFGVHTTVRHENDYTIIRYHDTDVVKFNSKEIILDNGGWVTKTTVARMGQAANEFNLGYRVNIKNGCMQVSLYGEKPHKFIKNIIKLTR